ncbi:MAG: penicillin-binding protein activator [Patescibacteria group bacterium]|jgi:branched-chain amino acid transport system substrate-binding protein
MNNTTKYLIGVIVVVVLAWSAFTIYQQQRVEEPVATGPVKIGWIGPLSGAAASYGESIKRGVEMAAKEVNAGTVELIYEDTKCEGADAVNAVTKLISVDHVSAIIGEVCSGATLAAAPIANQDETVLISPASTSPKLSEAGRYIFRTVPSDTLQGSYGAELVYNKGFRKLAVLYSNEEYGIGFNDVLSAKFKELGGEVVASETFGRDDTDVRTQVTKVRDANPDAVYLIVNNPETAVAALKQIKELGVKVSLFGSEGLKSPDVTAAGNVSEGLIVSSVSSGTSGFIDRHRAENNGADPGPFAAQGYDAMRAVNLAILGGARTGKEIADALHKLSFEGASGHISFDEHGDVAGGYDVLVVKNGAFVPAK